MLMSWAAPFPEEQNKLPQTQRLTSVQAQEPQKKKISSFKQLEMVDNENTLADFVPPKPTKQEYQPEKNVYDTPLYEPVQKTKEQDLIEKLNYMIFLLEEQRDERTGQVTEELILYLFLGIFTIFVLDTFVKTGKYSR
jgi:hypothetical protein